MENWLPIKGYEGLYEVSDMGNVRSISRIILAKNRRLPFLGRVLSISLDNNGYQKVSLCEGSVCIKYKVHRLVAIAFIPNPENKPEVNHKFGIKTDNRASELEWATSLENVRHAFKTGLNKSSQIGRTGAKSHHAKKLNQLSMNGDLIKTWPCAIVVESELGFAHSNIAKCIYGKRNSAYGYKWQHA